MLDLWNTVSLHLFDVLLGWTLALPRSVAVVVVGLITAMLLTLIRKWTTNQDRLRRAANDLGRLKKLRREAKRAGDKDAQSRYATTKGQISWIKLKAEGWPLLGVLAPLALLATWAFYRLEFHSPRADEITEVVVYLQDAAGKPAETVENDLLHLVPQPGLRAMNGWVQEVRKVSNEPGLWDRMWGRITFSEPHLDPDVLAIWQLQGESQSDAYPLVFRWRERTFEHELLIGQRVYRPAVSVHDLEPLTVVTETRLRDVRLLGIPGLGPWLPAWIVGYLLMTIPLVFVLKKCLGIY